VVVLVGAAAVSTAATRTIDSAASTSTAATTIVTITITITAAGVTTSTWSSAFKHIPSYCLYYPIIQRTQPTYAQMHELLAIPHYQPHRMPSHSMTIGHIQMLQLWATLGYEKNKSIGDLWAVRKQKEGKKNKIKSIMK
jgi:hypothetical protein